MLMKIQIVIMQFKIKLYHGENLFHKAPMLEIGFESDYHGNNAYMKAQNNGVLQNFDFHL